MAIKAVILDVSGTMLDKNNALVPGIADMVAQLKSRNLNIFFASNNWFQWFALKKYFEKDKENFLESRTIGGNKGRKKFIRHICSKLDIGPNEILYLGDSQNDFLEAINSGVIFFLAGWSNPNYPYGIPVATPAEFVAIIEKFFLKPALWYYSIDGSDGDGRSVCVRALLDPDVAKATGITTLLKSHGQSGNRYINGFKSSDYLSLHLISSIYLEGLHKKASGTPIWCMYPGHEGNYTPTLDTLMTLLSRLFRESYHQNLITRHQSALSSSRTRIAKGTVTLDTQLRTIQLNPLMQAKIKGRPVIVVDDFTTEAYGFETARNFLMNAGASAVICIAIGKYGSGYNALSPKEGIVWDSFKPNSLLKRDDFRSTHLAEKIDSAALSIFIPRYLENS